VDHDPFDLTAARAAWAQFADILGGADAVLDWPGLELDDLDRAEGLRYLARMTEVAIDAQLGTRSSEHPAFRVLSNGFGMDNPDNRYIGTPVDPRFDYVVRGRVGTLSYLSFAAQNQNFSNSGAITGGAGHLHARELSTDADGWFEIVASRQHQPGNWLRFADDTSLLLARQTRADPSVEEWVDLEVERLPDAGVPPPLDTSSISDRLAMAALYVVGATRWFVDWVDPWIRNPNSFQLADVDEQRRMGGDPNILAQSGYWTLDTDEQLEVTFRPPDCAYWNIQLCNVWAESFDVRRQVWLNHTTATVDDDGVARFVIAHERPSDPERARNWLDTAGHRHGLMHMRFVDSAGGPDGRWPLATTTTVLSRRE
jgi:hypothetical protein